MEEEEQMQEKYRSVIGALWAKSERAPRFNDAVKCDPEANLCC